MNNLPIFQNPANIVARILLLLLCAGLSLGAKSSTPLRSIKTSITKPVDCEAVLNSSNQLATDGDIKVRDSLDGSNYSGKTQIQNIIYHFNNYLEAAEYGHVPSQVWVAKQFVKGIVVDGMVVLAQNETKALKWSLVAAEQGHLPSQVWVARWYEQVRDYKLALKWYLAAAEQGNISAQIWLAKWYKQVQDYRSVFKWSLELAKKGHPSNQYYVGDMYERGQGVEKDDTQAMYWYEKAANQGHSAAEHRLAKWWYDGRSDYATAFKWNLMLAKKGYPSNQYYVGNMYEQGRGVEKDDTQAMYWYEEAAQQGHSAAMYRLAKYYDKGGEMVVKDEAKAMYWYEEAAQQGHTTAQLRLIKRYEQSQSYAELFKWNMELAKKRHPNNQYYVGNMYEQGWGVVKDGTQARYWYGEAAKQGHSAAQHRLAKWYEQKQNHATAFKWSLELAKKGHPSNQYHVGNLYEQGHGVKKDDTQARYWYEEAAKQGHSAAEHRLAKMYEQGRGGLVKDYVKAYAWSFLSQTTQGYISIWSNTLLTDLAWKMSSQQIDEAKQLAEQLSIQYNLNKNK